MGVPPWQHERVVSALKSDILENGGHLDTGIFGTQFFFEVLTENGLHELAYEVMNKRTFPSYGWWIEQGATTMWEQWDGNNSRNHPMFGGGIVWFYRKLAGMNADPDNPATAILYSVPNLPVIFHLPRIPALPPTGPRASAGKSRKGKFPYGDYCTGGQYRNGLCSCHQGRNCTESRLEVTGSEHIRFTGREGEFAVFTVNSGNYSFTAN
jgi:alpha-L-rhamnosidase